MNNVSRTERANILILAGLISLISLTNLLVVSLYMPESPPFGIYEMARARLFPLGHLLSVFVFLFVLFARKYVFSLLWLLICLLPFAREFIAAYYAIIAEREIYFHKPALSLMWLIANPFDYLAAFLLVTLILWHLSIIIRGYVYRGTVAE